MELRQAPGSYELLEGLKQQLGVSSSVSQSHESDNVRTSLTTLRAMIHALHTFKAKKYPSELSPSIPNLLSFLSPSLQIPQTTTTTSTSTPSPCAHPRQKPPAPPQRHTEAKKNPPPTPLPSRNRKKKPAYTPLSLPRRGAGVWVLPGMV